MTNFEQLRRENLIKEAHKLLDRADFLVAQMIQNAKNSKLNKAA